MSVDPVSVVEIHQLLAQYASLIDGAQYDQLGAVFTDEAVFRIDSITDETLHGLEEIIGHMQRIRHPLTHLIGNIFVSAGSTGDPILAGRAGFNVDSALVAVRRDGTVGAGRYQDVILQTDAGMRIASRSFTLTSSLRGSS